MDNSDVAIDIETPTKKGSYEDRMLYNRGKLSLFQFSIMAFVLTCGGPFGLEYMIRSAGPFYTLISLCCIPFLFSIPQSLMAAELSSMMPCNHGYIVWVYRGLGEFWGFMNAFNAILATCIDLPIYPVLMVDYFVALFGEDTDSYKWIEIYFIKFTVIVLAAILNIANITLIGKTSIIITCIIVTPFIVGFITSIPNINIDQWLITKPINNSFQYDWPIFISSILWLHTGWDKMGCLAGEIGFPKHRFFVGFSMAMILDWLVYTLPIIGALTIPYDYNDESWNFGYLQNAYDMILPGLKYPILIGAVLFVLAIYSVELAVHARAICAIAQPYIYILTDGKIVGLGYGEYDKKEILKLQTSDLHLRDESCIEDVSDDDGILASNDEDDDDQMSASPDMNNINDEQPFISNNGLYKKFKVSICYSWLGHYWKRTGAPVRAVIVQSIVNCILIAFPFDILVELTVFFFAFTWFLEFIAFLRLKYTEKDKPRPFVVPFGLFGAWFITIVTLLIVLFVAVITSYYNPTIFYIAIGYNIFVAALYGIRSCYWQKKALKTVKKESFRDM